MSTENRRPPSNWPHMGAISFCNVKMRYQKHLPLVIKDISFNIEPQEKIGNSYYFSFCICNYVLLLCVLCIITMYVTYRPNKTIFPFIY